jgi:hypothetical protein
MDYMYQLIQLSYDLDVGRVYMHLDISCVRGNNRVHYWARRVGFCFVTSTAAVEGRLYR